MKLSILLGVALVATLASVSAKPSSSSVGDCTKEDEGLTYGVPSDCQQYIVCKKGQLQVKQCEGKYNYDTVTAKCLKDKEATCAVEGVPEDPQPVDPKPQEPQEPQETNEQYDYLCAKILYGVRVHPSACDKYLVCSKEKATIEHCADGFIFVADAIVFGNLPCVKGNKVSCTVEREEPCITQPPTKPPTTEPKEKESEESKESKPESDESNTGDSSKESTPESGESDSGEISNEVDSGETGESSGEVGNETPGKYDYICENVASGKRAHPETCTKYISCKKSKAKEQNCKKGRYFSVYLQTCIKGNSETCAQGNGNDGSSTSEPTTVTEPSTTEAFTTKAPTTVTKVPTTEAPTTEAPTTATEPPTTEASTTEAPTTVTEPPTTEQTIPELTPPGIGGDPMQPNVECVEGYTGYLPIENDCSKYVYCFQGVPGERTCIDEYIYYHPFKACLPGDPVLCQLYEV
ncbi:hypothetical protein ZHAS_00017553 [Anopheles sinensis]|uniref:Chitin-binding type-2 domain-containing protein n=1 Tax=Anopheles sinensis TaxID=74873 RepID=A0A084WGV3_ANOSI|nr:hypothetical protein ZHAS_00017553 [Anopheles sinensis]